MHQKMAYTVCFVIIRVIKNKRQFNAA